MAARTPRQAVLAFVAALQQAVSCVSHAVLIREGHSPDGGPYTLGFPGGDPIRLPGRHRLSLSVAHNYLVDSTGPRQRNWNVRTVGYGYELLLSDGHSLLAYHWHPIGRSPITRPHLHLDAHTAPIDLTRAHLPTGLIALPGILRFVISDLGVEPQRSDWQSVLDAAETHVLLGGAPA